MAHLRQMVNISNELAQAINNFPIGMITLESFKTTHEKIKDVQRELRHLDAKFFELRATKLNTEEDDQNKVVLENVEREILDASVQRLVKILSINNSLESKAIEKIMESQNDALKLQLHEKLHLLFMLNDKNLKLESQVEVENVKHRELKVESNAALQKHREFLDVQEKRRNDNLQKKNPRVAQNKAKVEKSVTRLNVMRKLITNLIASNCHILKDEQELFDMLEKHRDLITFEDLLKPPQS